MPRCRRGVILLALLMSVLAISAQGRLEEKRQISIPGIGGGNTQQQTTTDKTTTQQTTTEQTTTSPTTTQQTTTEQTTTQQTTTAQTTDNTTQQQTTTQQTTTNAPSTTDAPQTSATPTLLTSTEGGSEVVVTQTVPQSNTASSSSAAPSSSQSSDDSSSSEGISTGSIIGLSVAGGVAVLGIIGFFVWKFTRKRFNDFDDNEAIKWPELNSHSPGDTTADTHALPVRDTGRAGFGDDSDSLYDGSRAPSAAGNYSTPDFRDPYAVPPIPSQNPNIPYRDDPSGAAGAYDPYRGPIPQTFGDPGEAIPMTQMRVPSPGPGRALSPNPSAFGGAPYMDGGYGASDRALSPAVGGYGAPERAISPGVGYGAPR